MHKVKWKLGFSEVEVCAIHEQQHGFLFRLEVVCPRRVGCITTMMVVSEDRE